MIDNKLNWAKPFLALRPKIMTYISKISPPAEVEDIVQEAYVKLYQLQEEVPKKHNSDGHCSSLLYTIAKNLALDHNKRAEVRLADGVESEVDYHTQDNDLTFEYTVTHERFGHLCEVIRCLPVQCRKVFVLKKVYGFTQKEIAQQLNISIKTVDAHVVNGMKRIKLYMDQVYVNSDTQQPSKKVGGLRK